MHFCELQIVHFNYAFHAKIYPDAPLH